MSYYRPAGVNKCVYFVNIFTFVFCTYVLITMKVSVVGIVNILVNYHLPTTCFEIGSFINSTKYQNRV